MTEEHKRKIQEGRAKALEEKKKLGLPLRSSKKTKGKQGKFINDKPVLILDGTEKNSVEIKPKLRQTLRPLHLYDLCKNIEKEISDPIYWQNRNWLVGILNKYLYVEIVEDSNKKEKIRKKSSYVMTPEHKEAMRLAREAKKKE